MPKEICAGIVVTSHPDYWFDMANSLSEIGVSVTLYLSERHAAAYVGSGESPHEKGLLSKSCQVRLFSLPRMRDPRLLFAARRVAEMLRSDEVEVAHLLVGPGDLLLATLAHCLADIPVVSTLVIPEPNIKERLPVVATAGIQRLVAVGSDLVIVNGEIQVPLVQKKYGLASDKVLHVPLGPPTSAMRWSSGRTSEQPGSVLFFGEARPAKGLQYLVEAQPQIRRFLPDSRIIIASRGEELYRCQGLIVDPSGFEITDGFVPGEQMASLFERAAVVVLPYLSASTSGILLMAYVFGKPVVATNVGCLPEYVQDGRTGLLVPPADSGALADAIVRLLSDDELRQRMGVNASHAAISLRTGAAISTLRAYQQTIALHQRNHEVPRSRFST